MMDDRNDIHAQLKAYSQAKKRDFVSKKAGDGNVCERTHLLTGGSSTQTESDTNYTCICSKEALQSCFSDCHCIGNSLHVCIIPIGSKRVPFRIHYTWPLFLLFFAIPAFYSSVVVGIFALVLMGPVLLLTVFFHELGHACMAVVLGGDVSQIFIWPLGGLAYVSFFGDQNPKVDALVAIAGPLTHIPQVGLWYVAMYASNRGVVQLFWPVHWGWDFWLALCSAAMLLQIALFLFNLIPAYPLDGGRLLGAFLSALQFNRNVVFMTTAFVGGLFGWYFLIEGFRGGDTADSPYSSSVLFSSGYELMIGIFLLINCVELWVLGMRGAAVQHPGFEWVHGARPAEEESFPTSTSTAPAAVSHRIIHHEHRIGQGHRRVSGFAPANSNSNSNSSEETSHQAAGGGNTAFPFSNSSSSSHPSSAAAAPNHNKMPGVGHRLGTADDKV